MEKLIDELAKGFDFVAKIFFSIVEYQIILISSFHQFQIFKNRKSFETIKMKNLLFQ